MNERTKKNTKTKAKTKKSFFSQISNIFGLKDISYSETVQFITGLIIMFISVFLILSFISYSPEDQSWLESSDIGNGSIKCHNSMGSLGAKSAHYFLNRFMGLPSAFIPLFMIFLSLYLMRAYKVNLWRKFTNFAFLMIWFSVALAYFTPKGIRESLFFQPGGQHGEYIKEYLCSLIGKPGLFLLIIVTAICYLIYLSHRTIVILKRIFNGEYLKKLKTKTLSNKLISLFTTDNSDNDIPSQTMVASPAIYKTEEKDTINHIFPTPQFTKHQKNTSDTKENTSDVSDTPFEVNEGVQNETADLTEQLGMYDPTLDLENYMYPTLDLLTKYDLSESNIDMDEQQENKNKIITILHNFGVEISSIKATVGPTITLYEITPARGVRIAKIRNLEDDIALSLSALGIRIIAPIPGKGTIGIEVPNKKPQIVSAESIFNSKKFQESTYELPIVLGKTITNEVYMVDLAKMPHLLVAGATGQGKSVGLNIIINSLLFKKHPSEFKLVLIDPKKVEFSVYSPLDKFFIAKVDDGNDDVIITDVNKVKKTLNSLCKEMDDRYQLLKTAKVRNIKEYNERFLKRQLNPEHGHRFLPYIVVVIDEFGDLIMTAGKEIELPIARIAQLARAIGIHMIIATQRPTTNIITGTIKANFPARMAFRVSAMIDSRTILDRPGANQLIGKGDMLFLAGGNNPDRVQCAFIDTVEVESIVKFISSQQLFPQPYMLPDVSEESSAEGGSGDLNNGNLDPLFEEVARLIVVNQSGSTSLIQRKFSIGYNRAGRLMDQLECAGVVGPSQGSKPRDVLIQDEIQLDQLISNLK